jgi:tripartite-type tricarboxylate transporter receptor subunit TctC
MELEPGVPTVSESGLPGFESIQWWAVSGPAGLPTPVIDRLNTELNRVVGTDDMRRRLAADGAEPGGGTPAALAAFIRKDYEKWGTVIRSVRMKAE